MLFLTVKQASQGKEGRAYVNAQWNTENGQRFVCPSYSPYWPSPYTFHKVLTRRICIKIKSFFSWRSFPLLNSPDLHDAWFRGDIVMRNMMLVTLKGHKLLKMHINWLQHIYYLLLKVPMTQIFVLHFLVDS